MTDISDTFDFQWHSTNACNFRCSHCYQEQFTVQDELDLDGLTIIAGRIADFLEKKNKKTLITVTGGEPLLKRELFSFLTYLDTFPCVSELSIITNGSLLDDEWIGKLCGLRSMQTIKLSLEGTTDETNDAIRGRGSFDTVLGTVKRIRKSGRFAVCLMMTLMRSNMHEMKQLVDFCRENTIDRCIVERFVPLGNGGALLKEVPDKKEWREAVLGLAGSCGITCDYEELSEYKAFQLSFSDNDVELSGALCTAGKEAVCIMPDGTVYPCRRFPHSYGNLLREPLEDILTHMKNSIPYRGEISEFKQYHTCPALSSALQCAAVIKP